MNEPRPHTDRLRRRVIAIFFLGLLFMAVVAVVIGWMVEIQIGWLAFDLGRLNRVLGFAGTAGGLVLVVWSVRIQYTLGRGTPAPRVPTQRLVVQGPYAYTRNPMTLGALFMYLGIGVWLGSGAIIALTLIVFSLLLSYIHARETRELTERFGVDYLEYKKRTSFLFPRFQRRV
jgi:protein-S-isoprenylcysteine O-methyltransferase Ste14